MWYMVHFFYLFDLISVMGGGQKINLEDCQHHTDYSMENFKWWNKKLVCSDCWGDIQYVVWSRVLIGHNEEWDVWGGGWPGVSHSVII